MRTRFRIQLDVVLGTGLAQFVTEAARRHYTAERVSAVANEFGEGRFSSDEEFIEDIEDALIQLTEHNPLLTNANVQIERATCEPVVIPERDQIDVGEPENAEAHSSSRHDEALDTDEAGKIWKNSKQACICAAGRTVSSRW